MLHTQPIATLRHLLTTREISPADLLRSVESSIADHDPAVGAYLHRDFPAALAEAEKTDLSLPLGGIPVGIKDIINVTGQPLTCGSKILAGKFTSPYDATVITRLRAAGAIPFGKLNMDEFAMGSSTENSALQVTRNPHDPSRVPGGSSGGSAAAVAAGTAVATLGTDTGGSIRQPASFCGIVGLKPSYGRVSRYGCTAYASSLDQIGPMTRSVSDAALLLQAIAGPDPADSTCSRLPVPDFSAALEGDVKGLRIGLPDEYFGEGIDPQVRASVEKAVALLESRGAEIQHVSLPHTSSAIATYYIIATAEASANLARFDGIRYGHRCDSPENLTDLYHRTRDEGFGPEVKRRILLGTYVLSSGYYDAYYRKASKVRWLIRQDFARAFSKVDVVLGPTAPTPAFRFGACTGDPLQMYLADIYTIAANLAGLCGISLPCGKTAPGPDAPSLPVGLQLLAAPFDEPTLLRAARAAELALTEAG